MRILSPTSAAVLFLLAAAVPAPAQDASAEAASRLRNDWSRGLDEMTPEEVDAHRAKLLEPLAVAADPVALDALFTVARDRADQVAYFKKRIETIEKKLEEQADAAEEAKRTGEKAPIPHPDDRVEILGPEKERLPAKIEREERWQPRLARAAGTVLDAMVDRDFDREGADLLRSALADPVKGYPAWVAEALGHSRKDRTAVLLLRTGSDALDEFRKALSRQAKPARALDEVNQKIFKIIQDYLEDRQKKGDMSGRVPDAAINALVGEKKMAERRELEREVRTHQLVMDSAHTRRGAARSALGSMLAGSDGEARDRLFDLLEKEALKSRDFEARIFGLAVLGPVGGDRAMKFLREAASDASPEVVVTAMDALGEREEAEAGELLLGALRDTRWQVRAAAAAGLGRYGRSSVVPALIAALDSSEGRTVDDVLEALKSLTGKTFPPVSARWNGWWSGVRDSFRGPRDPKPAGGGAAAGAGPEGADGAGPGEPASPEGGESVSFYGIETRSERMLFILDFSGSMLFEGSLVEKERRKIDVLYSELRKTLTGLKDGAKFNIIGFAADVRQWKKGAVDRSQKTAREAMDWVEKEKVLGSTNIYDSLERAFQLIGVGAGKDKNYEPSYDTIFFMTDGTPTSGKVTDTDLILGDVRRWNEGRKVKIHVIGMGGKAKAPGGPGGGPGPARGQRGNDLDEKFLKQLAADHGGECVIR